MTTRTAAALAAELHADTITLTRAQMCGFEESTTERAALLAKAQRKADKQRSAVAVLDCRHTLLTTVYPRPVAPIELDDCDELPVFGP